MHGGLVGRLLVKNGRQAEQKGMEGKSNGVREGGRTREADVGKQKKTRKEREGGTAEREEGHNQLSRHQCIKTGVSYSSSTAAEFWQFRDRKCEHARSPRGLETQ